MPQEYDNSMRGVLFKNDRRESENHPDYKGSAEVDGIEYWVSSWIKTKKDGSGKYLTLAFTKKDVQQGSSQTTSADIPADDDEIPF